MRPGNLIEYMSNLLEKYKKEAVPAMMKQFGYKSVMAVPRIEKVVINTGFGRQMVAKSGDEARKFLEFIVNEIGLIAGQKPVVTKAKKAIAAFKTRQGMPMGVAVTIRKQKMYDFISRLINIALPRSRDFQGIDAKSFDKAGNMSIAIKEHISFPEITPERAKDIFSLEITIVTNAGSREKGLALLKLMGFPIKA